MLNLIDNTLSGSGEAPGYSFGDLLSLISFTSITLECQFQVCGAHEMHWHSRFGTVALTWDSDGVSCVAWDDPEDDVDSFTPAQYACLGFAHTLGMDASVLHLDLSLLDRELKDDLIDPDMDEINARQAAEREGEADAKSARVQAIINRVRTGQLSAKMPEACWDD